MAPGANRVERKRARGHDHEQAQARSSEHTLKRKRALQRSYEDAKALRMRLVHMAKTAFVEEKAEVIMSLDPLMDAKASLQMQRHRLVEPDVSPMTSAETRRLAASLEGVSDNTIVCGNRSTLQVVMPPADVDVDPEVWISALRVEMRRHLKDAAAQYA